MEHHMPERAEIIQFIHSRLGFIPTPETKFWWDTGTAGLDAWAFMEDFATHFGVDMEPASANSGLDYDYGDSDTPLADMLSRLWRRITFRPIPRSNYFTIDHLLEVANRKEWFDPLH